MNKTVVVVVGVGGMGKVIAERQGAGHTLLLADYNQTTLEAITSELRADGHDVIAHNVDVGDPESVASLANVAAAAGDVVQLAYTAGLSPTQAPASAILRVDLVGVALALDAFGAIIAPGGAGVVISSMSAHLAGDAFPRELATALATTPANELLNLPIAQPEALSDPGMAYAIAKRGNLLRVQAASLTWAKRGARINSVSPGVISTAMGQLELSSASGTQMRAMVDASATGRLGTPSDIANAVAYLLGPEASFITGTDLLVDGGVVAATRANGPLPADVV